MAATKQFRDAWLRIERANQHVKDLKAKLDVFTASKPYETWADLHRKTGYITHYARLTRPLPDSFALITSDAVHSVRAALDNMICELARVNGIANHDRLAFPFAKTEASFLNDPRIQGKIKPLPAHLQKRIIDLKPYLGGNDLLWAIHDIDRADKHVRLVPIGYTPQQFGVRPKKGVHMDAVIAFCLPSEIGTETSIPLVRIHKTAKFDGYIDVQLNISFAQPETVKGQPLIPTLNKFIWAVSDIVLSFER